MTIVGLSIKNLVAWHLSQPTGCDTHYKSVGQETGNEYFQRCDDNLPYLNEWTSHKLSCEAATETDVSPDWLCTVAGVGKASDQPRKITKLF